MSFISEDEELSEYELLRQKNIQENIQKMKELGLYNEDFDKHRSEPLKVKPKIQRTTDEKRSTRQYHNKIYLTTEKRRSRRLSSQKIVQFSDEVSKLILGDIDSCSVSWGEYEEFFSVTEEKCNDQTDRTKPKRKSHTVSSREILSVDEITEDDLKRIAICVRDKVYSQDGTTCHQCRQKTEDQKTICRSSECFGVRGQFCGPCLKNRYGESVAEALKDPDWTCPPCRHMCNCSICRTHAGKIPTGQLTYFAQQRGFDSVKHLLDHEDEN